MCSVEPIIVKKENVMFTRPIDLNALKFEMFTVIFDIKDVL